jgi:hypothetical protein
MDFCGRVHAAGAAVMNEFSYQTAVRGADDEHAQAAMEWLCHSQTVTRNGGSAASYNLVLGWEEAYPETTGYIVPTMLSYAAAMDAPEIRSRALQMADWLCTVQHGRGSFPAGTGEQGEPNVFNTGQIVRGLVKAYRATGVERYRTAVRQASDWLLEQQSPAGYWDQFDYRNEIHTYLTRTAWALVEAGSILPKRADAYRAAATRNFRWAIEQQRPNGWFAHAGFDPDQAPYLHTIAYTVRGLLEGGLLLDESAILAGASRSADQLLAIQQSEGLLKGAYDESWSPAWYYCLTGNAQMAVIWLRLFEHSDDREYLRAARRAISFLKRRQVRTGPPAVQGGIAGSYPIVGRYMYLRFPNWAVKFFLDALLLARRLQSTEASGCTEA